MKERKDHEFSLMEKKLWEDYDFASKLGTPVGDWTVQAFHSISNLNSVQLLGEQKRLLKILLELVDYETKKLTFGPATLDGVREVAKYGAQLVLSADF